jgi:electron transfer flavoprotein beta subunit
MKIFVLLKTPRDAPGSDVHLQGLEPGDRAALATALFLARQREVQLVAISAGPKLEDEVLHTALKLGVSRAIRIDDPSLRSGDVRTISAMLAGAIRHLGYDLILAGNRSSEWSTGTIGPAVAHFLNVPHVTRAMSVAWHERQLSLQTQRRERVYACKLSLPAVVAVTSGPTELLTEEAVRKPCQNGDPPRVEPLDLTDMTLPFRYVDAGARPSLESAAPRTPQVIDGPTGLLQVLRRPS